MLKFSIDSAMHSMHPQDNRYPEYIAEQIKKGTTTCALTCSDGVVLAADTRASAGFFIADRHVMKIQKVDRHLGMTIAGGVADAQNLVDINQRYFPYYVQIIVAGYDKEGGQIYNIDLFGSMTSEKFISTGSGSPVAYGYLESEFKEGLGVNDAYKIAIRAIAAAIRRNAGTGDAINAVIIDKDGYRELSKEVKESAGVPTTSLI
jgi:proteasome beta subunit